MAWLVTHTLEAVNLDNVLQIYADKAKVKAQFANSLPINVAVDLPPEVASRLVRDIVEQVALGHSVEVVGQEVRRLSNLR